MQNLFQDLRYAVRRLLKSPGFTITAVLTLAIGIGVNTASFSIMDAVVLRPLAVPDLHRVVVVYERQNHGDPQQVSLANFEDWKHQSRSFDELAVRRGADMSLTGAGERPHVRAEYASPSFFSVLQTNAFLGRVFTEAETRAGGNGVAVLSYSFWKSHFGADAAVLDRKIELDQHAYTIIGVMPKTMQYPSTADFFLPLAPASAELANRTGHDYLVIGRLHKGTTPAQAQAEMNLISDDLSHAYPASNQGWSVKVESLLADINGDLTPLYFSLVQGATLFCPADCVCECCKFAICPRHCAASGDGHADCAWCRPLAFVAAATHGEHSARADRRCRDLLFSEFSCTSASSPCPTA